MKTFKTLLPGHALVKDENGREMHKSWVMQFGLMMLQKKWADVMRWMYAGQTLKTTYFWIWPSDEIRKN